ncbi:hypothetical protein PIB30_068428 [Stylosanthes scabra]|uniref:Uncharacterized protein n=1 Tax=Stylosanthes scabra TaxID=79078 RepID=A0ABU6VPR4_9FABA|nr:hypothetical protein [Stylosanthes scabra]
MRDANTAAVGNHQEREKERDRDRERESRRERVTLAKAPSPSSCRAAAVVDENPVAVERGGSRVLCVRRRDRNGREMEIAVELRGASRHHRVNAVHPMPCSAAVGSVPPWVTGTHRWLGCCQAVVATACTCRRLLPPSSGHNRRWKLAIEATALFF